MNNKNAHENVSDRERLVKMLKALGNPVRFQIVQFLAERQVCITNDIVRNTPLAQSTVSQHLKVLREAGLIEGYTRSPQTVVEGVFDGQQYHHDAAGYELAQPISLDGDWEFIRENENALVLGKWLARAEDPGTEWENYAQPGEAGPGWLPMVPGAWSYQLPTEPDREYPIPVWYRIPFEVETIPERLEMIVDGFAGLEWSLYVNGQPVEVRAVRSKIDSQMKAVDITEQVQGGQNLIALRLVVSSATDGLLDLVKLVGNFSLFSHSHNEYCIVTEKKTVKPASWTEQGYPFFSGRAVYRKAITLPEAYQGQRVFLEMESDGDVIEVRVNGNLAGIKLWAPYEVELTEWIKPGENVLELRIANTLVNLLEAVERKSGLTAAPRLIAYPVVKFQVFE